MQRGPVGAQRERVKQRLGGVFVGAVAGVDHRGVDPVGGGQAGRGAGGAVPDDHRVGADGLQGLGGVLERFALGDRGALGGEVDDVRAQALGGGLEGDAGAGGVLEEEVDHGAAAQRRELLDLAGAHGGHFLGDVQDPDGVGARQVQGGEQVFHARGLDDDFVVVASAVDLGKVHAHLFGGGGGQVLADVVGADGKFAVAAVNQHGQADDARAAQVGDGVQGGADGAPGVQHVVDQHHDLVVDAGGRKPGGHAGCGWWSGAGRRGTW